jgi:hypothetical protein
MLAKIQILVLIDVKSTIGEQGQNRMPMKIRHAKSQIDKISQSNKPRLTMDNIDHLSSSGGG